MGTLVLLRHGESQWNLENRFTGWVDVPLSPKGEEEARQAGEKLKAAGIRFDLAFTSVLQRAIRTMEITLEILGQNNIPVEKDQALNERHYGTCKGSTKRKRPRSLAMNKSISGGGVMISLLLAEKA